MKAVNRGTTSVPLKAAESQPLIGGKSYSLRHRLYRALWSMTWALFAAWTPPLAHRWRVLLLKCFGARVAWTAHVYGSVRIWYPGNLTIGEHACLARRVNCYCMGPIVVGDNAIVSQGAYLCGGTHDIDDKHFQLVPKQIIVGDKSWVGAEAFVGPGADIGKSAIIGARAVLFGRAVPFGIYIGNPARRIRDRKEVAS